MLFWFGFCFVLVWVLFCLVWVFVCFCLVLVRLGLVCVGFVLFWGLLDLVIGGFGLFSLLCRLISLCFVSLLKLPFPKAVLT